MTNTKKNHSNHNEILSSELAFEEWFNSLQYRNLNQLLSAEQFAEEITNILPNLELASQALSVLKFTLYFDLKLGAKVAGIVKPELQPQSVNLVDRLNVPKPFKMRLLGITGSKWAIDSLLQGLSDRDAAVRRSAARALVKISSASTSIKLLQLLNHEISDTRGWAAWLLAQIGTETVILELKKCLHHVESHVRVWAIWALGEIAKTGSSTAFNNLLKALKHDDSQVRLLAATALGEIVIYPGFPDPSMALVQLLECLDDPNNDVQIQVITALGKIGDTSAVSALVEKLNDRELFIIISAIESLGKIGGKVATEALLKALKHKNYNVRSSAILGLEKIGTDLATKEIADVILADEDDMVRVKAVETLGRIGSCSTVAQLLFALNDSEYYVRLEVVNSLRKIGSNEVIPGLVNALSNSMSSVRQKAIEALAEIRSEAALAALENAQGDRYPEDVRSEAKVAWQQIHHTAENSSKFTQHKIKTSTDNSLPEMAIVSYIEACEQLSYSSSRKLIQSIISIGSYRIPSPPGFSQVPNRLRLEFDDIDAPIDDPKLVLPTFEDILKVIEFVPNISQNNGFCLVHCQAGISRSSAVALTVCAAIIGPGKEREAMDYVLEVNSYIRPNIWIVELADEALARDGKLVEVAQEHQDIFERPGYIF